MRRPSSLYEMICCVVGGRKQPATASAWYAIAEQLVDDDVALQSLEVMGPVVRQRAFVTSGCKETICWCHRASDVRDDGAPRHPFRLVAVVKCDLLRKMGSCCCVASKATRAFTFEGGSKPTRYVRGRSRKGFMVPDAILYQTVADEVVVVCRQNCKFLVR